MPDSTTDHRYLNGPLRKFLSQCMEDRPHQTLNINSIEVPLEVLASLTLGQLQEEFDLKNVPGTEDEIEETLLKLIGKFYGSLDLESENTGIFRNLRYAPKGGAPGLGVLVGYTFMPDDGWIRIRVQNFES